MRLRCYSSAYRYPVVLYIALAALAIAPVSVPNAMAHTPPLNVVAQLSTPAGLPPFVVRRLKRSVAREVGVAPRQLRLVGYRQETWPDGCLGLGGIADLCLAALVPGWRVSFTNGETQWHVRSNQDGSVVRMESVQQSERLPDAVREAVLTVAAQESGLSTDRLHIDSAQARTFDGCFGIDPGAGGACTMIAIAGWQVIVSSDRQTWVYHTNADGSEVRLNPIAGVDAQRVQLTILPEGDRLQVPSEAVFQS